MEGCVHSPHTVRGWLRQIVLTLFVIFLSSMKRNLIELP